MRSQISAPVRRYRAPHWPAPVFSGGVALQTPRRIFICMAPQFGDYLDVRRRTLPPAEALAMAKAFLPSFDYIGFD